MWQRQNLVPRIFALHCDRNPESQIHHRACLCESQSSRLQRMLVLVKDAFNVFLQSQLRYGDHSGVNFGIYWFILPKAPWPPSTMRKPCPPSHLCFPHKPTPESPPTAFPSQRVGIPFPLQQPLCLFPVCFFAVGRQLAQKSAPHLALFPFPLWDQAELSSRASAGKDEVAGNQEGIFFSVPQINSMQRLPVSASALCRGSQL